MHRLKKILIYQIAFIVAIVSAVAFAIAFEIGAKTVDEAEVLTKHTGQVLEAVADAQNTSDAAVNAGRQVLLGNSVEPKPFRDSAFTKLDALKRRVGDNPEQISNVDAIATGLQKRFDIQDAQAAKATRQNGTITLNAETTAESSEAAYAVENAFTRLRIAELGLLQSRDTDRITKQRKVVLWLRVFGLVCLTSLITFIWSGYRELKLRGRIHDKIEAIGKDPKQLTNGRIAELLAFIDKGEEEKKRVSSMAKVFF